MKILVEECSYDPAVLKGVLPEGRLLLTGDKVKIESEKTREKKTRGKRNADVVEPLYIGVKGRWRREAYFFQSPSASSGAGSRGLTSSGLW